MIKLGELEGKSGMHDLALAAASRAIAINTLREDAHRVAMRALAAAGRRADALKHYQDLAKHLKSELDVEPDRLHDGAGARVAQVAIDSGGWRSEARCPARWLTCRSSPTDPRSRCCLSST